MNLGDNPSAPPAFQPQRTPTARHSQPAQSQRTAPRSEPPRDLKIDLSLYDVALLKALKLANEAQNAGSSGRWEIGPPNDPPMYVVTIEGGKPDAQVQIATEGRVDQLIDYPTFVSGRGYVEPSEAVSASRRPLVIRNLSDHLGRLKLLAKLESNDQLKDYGDEAMRRTILEPNRTYYDGINSSVFKRVNNWTDQSTDNMEPFRAVPFSDLRAEIESSVINIRTVEGQTSHPETEATNSPSIEGN